MKMFRSTVIILGVVGACLARVTKREAEAKADAEPGYGGYSSGPKCQEKVDRQCHKVPKQNQRKVPRQVCHQEYDTIVDTTYIEECQDIVTQHCNSVSKQVSHSSAVVGHDSQVVSHGHGYGKREAEADAEPGYGGYSSGPQCQQKVDRQCQKVPHQNARKVARPVCKQIAIKVPYEVCGSSYTHRSQASLGHSSYGYH